MNREAEDLRKAFFHAIFERGRNVVDLSDGKAAVHRAVARNQDFVIDAADVNFVAVKQFVVFRLKRIQEILNRAREAFHFFSACYPRAKRLDVNIHAGARIGGATDVFFEFCGAAMRFAQAGAFVHFKMQLDEEAAFELMG